VGRPPPLLALENVPRIATRGAELLAKVRQLLSRYGYAFHEANHDCGEVGGLAQHRRRYLMVARHQKSCTAYVYKPPKLRVRGCGEVLGELPMPTDPDAGRCTRWRRSAG
jgi:site-specific DNA-cytosine methylase